MDCRLLALGEKIGIVVHPITDAQRDQWRQVTAPVTEKLIDALGGRSREIYETIQRARAEYRVTRR